MLRQGFYGGRYMGFGKAPPPHNIPGGIIRGIVGQEQQHIHLGLVQAGFTEELRKPAGIQAPEQGDIVQKIGGQHGILSNCSILNYFIPECTVCQEKERADSRKLFAGHIVPLN